MITSFESKVLGKKVNKDWEFPAFRVDEYGKKKSKYCICVFVINEGEKIRKQLKAMQPYAGRVDIIVADGGSTDGSLGSDFLESLNLRALVTKKGTGKLSAQMRAAFVYALEEGYEGIIVVDGNGKDDLSAIPQFIEALEDGYDHVQGSRFIPGGKAVNTPLIRLIAVRLLHAPLISLAAGKKYTDTTNGFRAYSAQFLKDRRVAPLRNVFTTYELHYYLAIRSVRLGFRTKEIPVTRTYPKHGPIPTKISPIRGNASVLHVLWKAITHQFNPKSS